MAERSEVTIKGSLNNLGLDAYQHDTARNDLLAFAKEKLQEGAEDLINYDPWANEYIDHLRKMWKHPWVVNIMKSHSDAPDQAIQDISNIMFRQVKEQRRKWQNKKPSQKIASAPAKGGSETRNDADDSDNHDCAPSQQRDPPVQDRRNLSPRVTVGASQEMFDQSPRVHSKRRRDGSDATTAVEASRKDFAGSFGRDTLARPSEVGVNDLRSEHGQQVSARAPSTTVAISFLQERFELPYNAGSLFGVIEGFVYSVGLAGRMVNKLKLKSEPTDAASRAYLKGQEDLLAKFENELKARLESDSM